MPAAMRIELPGQRAFYSEFHALSEAGASEPLAPFGIAFRLQSINMRFIF
jgi:hypothetical protein